LFELSESQSYATTSIRIDLAYRIRENDHPDFGGLEIEILGLRPAGRQIADS
jgi:hypothetical protein